MRMYNTYVKKYFSPLLKPWRKAGDMTQEKASEVLGISNRAYAELERGKIGFSAVTLLLFLSLLSDEEIVRLVREFRAGILLLAQSGAA